MVEVWLVCGGLVAVHEIGEIRDKQWAVEKPSNPEPEVTATAASVLRLSGAPPVCRFNLCPGRGPAKMMQYPVVVHGTKDIPVGRKSLEICGKKRLGATFRPCRTQSASASPRQP